MIHLFVQFLLVQILIMLHLLDITSEYCGVTMFVIVWHTEVVGMSVIYRHKIFCISGFNGSLLLSDLKLYIDISWLPYIILYV
jgi:hypothetical protein